MKTASIPKQAFGFFVEDMDGEKLLYRLGAHKAIHLNQSAAVIWTLCDGTRTVADIIKLLAEEYPGSEPDIESDVRTALDMLGGEGALLETEPEATPASNDPV
jgi:coenzyme PQQ biosynthesis protein PqqD